MNGIFNRTPFRAESGLFDFDGGGVLKALLLRSTGSYVFNPDHDFISDMVSNGMVEITVASYGRITLTGRTVNLDDTLNRSWRDVNDISFGILESGQTVSAICIYEHVTNDADSIPLCYYDGKIKVTAAAPAALPTSGSITGATQANPCVLTVTAHPFVNGDLVKITGVVGMTQLNGNVYTVAGAATNTFQLSGVNSTGFTAYSSGGTAKLVRTVYVDPLSDAIQDGAAIDFGSGATGLVYSTPAAGARSILVADLAAAITAAGTEAVDVQSTLPLPASLGGGTFSAVINALGLIETLAGVR